MVLPGTANMGKRLVSTGGFVATDGTGKRFQFEVFTEFEDITGAGYFRSVAGMKSIKTATGQHVNPIEKGKYQIAETGVVLTSDDPSAP
jgi:hypothetical protein